jgi:hypothetical protein
MVQTCYLWFILLCMTLVLLFMKFPHPYDMKSGFQFILLQLHHSTPKPDANTPHQPMAPAGEENFSPPVHNHGQTGHFTLYLTDVRTRSLGSGTEGCEISNQWHRPDDIFFRGKLRILITFGGTQGIPSIL